MGYFDGPDGALSHHLWFDVKSAEYGPYHIRWMAYETPEQFLELLGVIRSLGDQVRSVSLIEPPGVQIQEYLKYPFQNALLTHRSRFEMGITSLAWWQVRICDLEACLAKTHLRGDTVRFNLSLTDPIERYLEERKAWRGVSGDYIVTLGPESGVQPGSDPTLDTLSTSVNTFSRLWLGVRPASGLAMGQRLEAPPGLLAKLDEVLRLPRPVRDWDF